MNPLAPVWYQSNTVLKRLRCEGDRISVGNVSRLGGVSIEIVVKCTGRIISALYDIGHQLIECPNAMKHKEIPGRINMNHGLKGSVAKLNTNNSRTTTTF